MDKTLAMFLLVADVALNRTVFEAEEPVFVESDCQACGAPGMRFEFFDACLAEDPERPGFDVEGRCTTCGTC